MAVVDVDMQIVEDAEENYQVRGEYTQQYTTSDKADHSASSIADLARTDWVSAQSYSLCQLRHRTVLIRCSTTSIDTTRTPNYEAVNTPCLNIIECHLATYVSLTLSFR